MFTLKEQKAKLTSVNPRAEIHGEDTKLACDIGLEIKVSNDVLSEFDPQLKSALYRAPDASDTQADLLADQPGYMPKQKFPLLGKLSWGWEGIGYGATVHYGVTGRADINLIQTQVDKFKFDCQDGGTVVCQFRLIAHPTPEELGRLCEMIQQEVSITLDPPSAEELFQMERKRVEAESEEED